MNVISGGLPLVGKKIHGMAGKWLPVKQLNNIVAINS
jgi:hypothetical protein